VGVKRRLRGLSGVPKLDAAVYAGAATGYAAAADFVISMKDAALCACWQSSIELVWDMQRERFGPSRSGAGTTAAAAAVATPVAAAVAAAAATSSEFPSSSGLLCSTACSHCPLPAPFAAAGPSVARGWAKERHIAHIGRSSSSLPHSSSSSCFGASLRLGGPLTGISGSAAS